MRFIFFIVFLFFSTLISANVNKIYLSEINTKINQSFFNDEDRKLGNRPLRSALVKKMYLNENNIESNVFIVKRMTRNVDNGLYAITVVYFEDEYYIMEFEGSRVFKLTDRIYDFKPLYILSFKDRFETINTVDFISNFFNYSNLNNVLIERFYPTEYKRFFSFLNKDV